MAFGANLSVGRFDTGTPAGLSNMLDKLIDTFNSIQRKFILAIKCETQSTLR